ncbi:MAG TPA: CRTAC1 family protein [Bryobacteraceae bacterium]|nr:CRTAC1 family protein [Bryobacteraceae bacterium]
MYRGLLVLGVLGVLCGCAQPGRHNAPAFEDVARETGLNFWHFSGATGDFLLPELMGSGAAFIDYDNDGDLDVYLIQGAPTGPQGTPLVPVPPGWKPGNRLFRNNLKETGKLTFTDVTGSSGLGLADKGMGVAAGDYDNDGYTDLYVTNYGHNVLYHNNGNGTFTDVTAGAGVASSGWSSSAAFLDYDKDGLLDLAVVHYLDFYRRPCYTPQGSPNYCGPQPFKGTITELYHNLGNGRFRNVTADVGLDKKPGPGLGILTGDFGASGFPDFLVADDGAANHLWINSRRSADSQESNRVLHEEGVSRGLAYASDGKPRAGMGIADGDVYGDGGEALVVTNIPTEAFTLFQRQSNGDFVDATEQSGLSHISLPFTGFGVGLIDIENRGWLDLFSANGAVNVTMEPKEDRFPYKEKKLLLRNMGKGKGFQDITASAGPVFQIPEVSRAAVFGDVNNDGGVDILVTNNNGPARLLLNTARDRGHWLLVHLEGTRTNRSAYGSVVEVVRKDGTSVKRYVRGDASYLAANDPRAHFGLGRANAVDRIQVYWLAGGCEIWKPAAVDRIVNLREGGGTPCPALSASTK